MEDRKRIRGEMRARRRALSPAERARAARNVLRELQGFLRLRRGMRLAVYLAADGELDTRPVIEYAQRLGCRLFVPIVRRYSRDGRHLSGGASLWFVPLAGPMRRNRFGIEEPVLKAQQRIDPRALDVVLVPLVAFGAHGERLGSGAGFYDQTFSFRRLRRCWKMPRLIGIGYRWQECRELSSAPWDVALDAAITDGGVHRFASR